MGETHVFVHLQMMDSRVLSQSVAGATNAFVFDKEAASVDPIKTRCSAVTPFERSGKRRNEFAKKR